ncbi:MAG: NADH-quinone oxidoreductase subunit N [Pirellulales bacterium]|nr:NADH-quinone oxidoreductase subunit N [Pirellulales bacterium]
MNLQQLIKQLANDSTESLSWFLPEIVLCAVIMLLLLVRLFDGKQRLDLWFVAIAGSVVSFLFSQPWLVCGGGVERTEIFTGLLVIDGFTIAVRSIILLFLVLFLVFTKISGIPDSDDSPDIYTLVFGATLGMCLMVSSNHLLMIFLAIEMASVPSYALAGMLKGRKRGSEAALKYAIYGAGAAGVMLYGISLLAGLTSSAHLPTIALQLAENLGTMSGSEQLVLVLSGLLISVGLAFKLSAVPFHFWAPDVFHGSCAEVNAFLSIASKAAALGLLVRIGIGVGYVPGLEQEVAQDVEAGPAVVAGLLPVAEEAIEPIEDSVEQEVTVNEALQPVRDFIGKLIALLAMITCTFGNLAAYSQTNIKRLLAYSTIAHAGYMMMAIAPLMSSLGSDYGVAEGALSGLLLYIVVYVFMNLGAFAVVAFLRNYIASEEIADYSGMIRSRPYIVICLVLALFSLVGLPPLAGFLGKFAVFASIADAFRATDATYLLVLLLVGGVNTALSLYYYLRVAKIMVMEEPAEGVDIEQYPKAGLEAVYLVAITLPTALLIFFWNPVHAYVVDAVKALIS